MRKIGLGIIGEVPWGFHFAVAYQNISKIGDILVPYFRAGLENKELCVMITSDIFTKGDFEEVMRKNIPNFDKYRKNGRMEVIPFAEWYLQEGKFSKNKVSENVESRRKTLKDSGLKGLRIFGETNWVKNIQFRQFISYEKSVDKLIRNKPIIALCGYCVKNFSAYEALHIVCAHKNVLVKYNASWRLIKCFQNRSLREEMSNLRKDLALGNSAPQNKEEDLFQIARKQIKKIRVMKGLTQAEIAHRVGISQNFIGLIERGERTPGFKTLGKIAFALGFSVKEIVQKIENVPKEKNGYVERINGYLNGCTPSEKRLINGFIRVLIKERRK